MAQARIGQDWDEAEEIFEAGTLFDTEVSGHNRGGLIVYMGGVRGFVPASQIDRRRAFKREEIDGSPTSPLATLVGQELTFKIIELDRRGNRLILSELAAMRERRKVSKAQLLDELQEGQIKEGIVTSLADFGAFVDIGGADGLVHLSELTWGRVSHPKEILELGEKVKVKVISVDRERKRIGLSLKALAPEPWSTVEERYVVGEVVEAEITRLADFGAFARLDEEIEGLIHVTELSDLSQTPEEIVSPGEKVAVRIIRIDPERKRIGLSLKRADGAYDALGIDERTTPSTRRALTRATRMRPPPRRSRMNRRPRPSRTWWRDRRTLRRRRRRGRNPKRSESSRHSSSGAGLRSATITAERRATCPASSTIASQSVRGRC